jgi:hypothetical protein
MSDNLDGPDGSQTQMHAVLTFIKLLSVTANRMQDLVEISAVPNVYQTVLGSFLFRSGTQNDSKKAKLHP